MRNISTIWGGDRTMSLSADFLKSFHYTAAFSAALLLGCSLHAAVTHAQSTCGTDPNTNCWTTAGGTDQGTRYSTLADITSSNAQNLKEEFLYSTQVKHSHQGSPIVVRTTVSGVTKVMMYIVTPFPNNLLGLDVTKAGAPVTLWKFEPQPKAFAEGLTCCDSVNRGPVYGETTISGVKTGLVVYNLLDGDVVAVNAKTGKQVWRKKVADPWKGETLNTAPIIVKGKDGVDKVIFGSSGSEMGTRGSVRALNLTTGALVWQAYSTGPDTEVRITASTKPFYPKDQGKDLGKTSWPADMYKIGGATTWTWVTYDPVKHTIFYGTSQPGAFNPSMRPGDNKWASAIFARDPDSGDAKWVYQTQPHDNWDYDAMNENTVVDLPINGSTRNTIVHLHKNGIAYVMDRVSGEIISANPFGYENWSGGGIDLASGNPKSYTPQTQENTSKGIVGGEYTVKTTIEGQVTENICPSAFGVKNWGYSTFSPKTNLFYFGTFNLCQNYSPTRVNYIAGTPYVGADIAINANLGNGQFPGSIGSDGFMMGEFVAFDPVTGQRKWTIREPKIVVGGALSTAGNVVFYGTTDGYFKAVDADPTKAGKVLFSKKLECGIVSAPITYKGGDGKQRIAVTTGLGWLNGAFSGTGPCNGYVHVFKL